MLSKFYIEDFGKFIFGKKLEHALMFIAGSCVTLNLGNGGWLKDNQRADNVLALYNTVRV